MTHFASLFVLLLCCSALLDILMHESNVPSLYTLGTPRANRWKSTPSCPLQMQDFRVEDMQYSMQEYSLHPSYSFRISARDLHDLDSCISDQVFGEGSTSFHHNGSKPVQNFMLKRRLDQGLAIFGGSAHKATCFWLCSSGIPNTTTSKSLFERSTTFC